MFLDKFYSAINWEMDLKSTSSPQHSDVFSEELDNSSAKDGTLLSNTTLKPNFQASYVPVQTPTKSKMRGQKTFAFWTLVCLLFMLAIGNLLLTVTILGVLKIGQGMQNLELISKTNTIKFFGDIDLDHIYKRDGLLEGYEGESVEIVAEESPIIINFSSKSGKAYTKFKIDEHETLFRGFNTVHIKNKHNEKLFNVNEPHFANMKNVNHLRTKHLSTNKIRSPIDSDLKIEGENVNLKGSEGAKMEGKEVNWRADQDIYLNGSIVLSGIEGIYINSKRIPTANENRAGYLTSQFKICVCMPQGKLFKIPIANTKDKVYCNFVVGNPCM